MISNQYDPVPKIDWNGIEVWYRRITGEHEPCQGGAKSPKGKDPRVTDACKHWYLELRGRFRHTQFTAGTVYNALANCK